MAEVTWIKGTIDPPQSGEYYVTLEAKQERCTTKQAMQ